MYARNVVIITVVLLTALLAGFGATYVEQHVRLTGSDEFRMASNAPR